MPGNSITEALNGATVIHGNTTPTEPGKRDRYRPDASTRAVHEEVLRSLATVVTTALSNAGYFVYLADVYDRDETTAIRYGHGRRDRVRRDRDDPPGPAQDGDEPPPAHRRRAVHRRAGHGRVPVLV